LRDSNYAVLFEFIRFENLSTESLHDFVKFISNSCEFLTFPIWSSFIQRVNFSNCGDQTGGRYRLIGLFVPRDGFAFDGIISFLTGKCGGNVHDKGIVEVSASSVYWSDCPAKVVVDFNSSARRLGTANAVNS
jgi:hypothetical protein